MTIIYSCIARGTTILCSHGNQVGDSNYEKAAEAVLPQIPTRNDGKTTITASRLVGGGGNYKSVCPNLQFFYHFNNSI